MLTTDYMVKASLEKHNHLLAIRNSGEFLNTISFGIVAKPLKYRKPAKKRAMNILPYDLLFFIEGVKEADIKAHKKLFAKGEFCRIEELKLIQKGKEVFMVEIEQLSDDVFFRQLVKDAGIVSEDPVTKKPHFEAGPK